MNTSWTCEVNAGEGELTVGQPFNVKCGGPEVPGFNSQTMSLELAKAERFNLRILETKSASPTGVDLVVTSYVAGEVAPKNVVLTDGVNRVELQGVHVQVKTVLKEGEEPKPFPSEPPVSMMWPMSAILTIAAVILGILLVIAFIIQRARRRRKFKLWLQAQKTPLSPFDQLNKDLRMSQKERDPATQIRMLEEMTRKFLSRTFEAPLMVAPAKKVLKVITHGDKKSHGRLEPLTIRLFGEFDRISESLKKGELAPLEAMNSTLPQVQELVREFGEIVNRENLKNRGAK